ncbi:hypothetical protein M433DRAFT_153760 [Acidomyces richmondensis BFW]|nr:MAG: hypothetical protein FE78DRAFT_89606 [Acidomyces sp. 'richmondensis']KYG46097.1 hypothetical protein M433DRAFT_153760 [Acidomyces richmondensis BFW]
MEGIAWQQLNRPHVHTIRSSTTTSLTCSGNDGIWTCIRFPPLSPLRQLPCGNDSGPALIGTERLRSSKSGRRSGSSMHEVCGASLMQYLSALKKSCACTIAFVTFLFPLCDAVEGEGGAGILLQRRRLASSGRSRRSSIVITSPWRLIRSSCLCLHPSLGDTTLV